MSLFSQTRNSYQDLFHPANGRINGVLWSVAAEWRIYFLFPVMLWAWRQYGAVKTTVASLIIAIMMHWMLPHVFHRLRIPIHIEPTMLVPEYVALFCFGALAAGMSLVAEAKIVAWRRRTPWWLIATVPFALVYLMKIRIGSKTIIQQVPNLYDTHSIVFNVLIGVGSCALMVGLTLGHWPLLRRVFEGRALTFAGTISYSLYLIHYPLLQALLEYVVTPMRLNALVSGLVLVPFGLIVTLLTAYGFYRLVEEPSHSWASQRKKPGVVS